MALLTQLRTGFKLDGRIYRVYPSGEVQYLHPKDGVYPEKVNKSRVGVNNVMRSIGKNPNPAQVRGRALLNPWRCTGWCSDRSTPRRSSSRESWVLSRRKTLRRAFAPADQPAGESRSAVESARARTNPRRRPARVRTRARLRQPGAQPRRTAAASLGSRSSRNAAAAAPGGHARHG